MPTRTPYRDRPKPPKPVLIDRRWPCLTVDCDGMAMTRKGVRQKCKECRERDERIAAMAARLRKASDPAFGRVREHRFAEVMR